MLLSLGVRINTTTTVGSVSNTNAITQGCQWCTITRDVGELMRLIRVREKMYIMTKDEFFCTIIAKKLISLSNTRYENVSIHSKILPRWFSKVEILWMFY